MAQDLGVRYASTAVLGNHDLAGRRAPHAWVRMAGRTVSTLDLFGDRLTVLTGGATWPGTSTVPVAALAVRRDFADIDGGFAAAYPLASGDAVLVRPDGYVVWAGPIAGIEPAVAGVTGRPALHAV